MATSSRLSKLDRSLSVSAILVLFFFLVAPVQSSAQGVANPGQEQVNASAEASTVQIAIKWEGYVNYTTATGNEWTTKPIVDVRGCSGFFVSTTGQLVTAGHCVQPDRGRENILEAFLNLKVKEGQLTSQEAANLWSTANLNWKVEGNSQGSPVIRTVYVGQPKGVTGAALTEPLVAQVQDIKPFREGDCALLKVEMPGQTPALPIASADPKTGAAVTSIGFPGTVEDSVAPGKVRASFKTGTISSQQITDAGVAVTEINADISQGMSGGPTVDAQGNVLGVNSYKLNGEQQNFNFITDTSDLKSWLTGKNVALVAEKAAAGPGGQSDRPITVSAPAESGGIPWYVWVIGGVVLLAAVIVLLVFLMRRKRPAEQFRPVSADAFPPTDGIPPFCRSCGAQTPPGAHFCGSCGRPIAVQPAPQQHQS